MESCSIEDIIVPPDIKDTIKIDSTKIYPNCIEEASLLGKAVCIHDDQLLVVEELFGDSLYLEALINPTEVLITNSCTYYQLPFDGIEVNIAMKGTNPDSVYFNYCNDVIFDNEGTPIKYPVSKGSMVIAVEVDTLKSLEGIFKGSVQFTDLQFNGFGNDTIISEVTFYKVNFSSVP